jgi:hypothetical protein
MAVIDCGDGVTLDRHGIRIDRKALDLPRARVEIALQIADWLNDDRLVQEVWRGSGGSKDVRALLGAAFGIDESVIPAWRVFIELNKARGVQ